MNDNENFIELEDNEEQSLEIELTNDVEVASTTHKGKIRIATDAEALEGVVDNAAITPYTLDLKTQSIEEKTQTFIFEQGVASDTWEIQHNLNKFPSINVVDSAGNSFIPAYKYIDENNIILYMNGSFKGKAYLN